MAVFEIKIITNTRPFLTNEISASKYIKDKTRQTLICRLHIIQNKIIVLNTWENVTQDSKCEKSPSKLFYQLHVRPFLTKLRPRNFAVVYTILGLYIYMYLLSLFCTNKITNINSKPRLRLVTCKYFLLINYYM